MNYRMKSVIIIYLFREQINKYLSISNIYNIDQFIKNSAEKFDTYSLSFIISEFLNTDI